MISNNRRGYAETTLAAASGALLLVAVLVRLPGFGVGQLWGDDAWVALQERAPLSVAVHMGASAPGFNALESLWISLDPYSAWWAQVPIFLCALATIPLTVWIVRWATGSGMVGVTAGAVLAFSPVGITYATRVKQYPFDAALTLVVLSVSLRMIERPSRLLFQRLCFVAAAAALFSFSTLPVVTTSLAAVVLHNQRRPDRQSSMRLALVAVPVSAVLLAAVWTLTHLSPALHTYWRGLFPSWGSGPIAGVRTLANDTRGLFVGLTALPALVGAAWAVVAVGLLLWAKRWMSLLVLLSPIVLAYAIDAVGLAPLGGGRIDMWLYPAIAIILGLGLEAALRLLRLGLRRDWLTVVVAAAVLLCAALHHHLQYYPLTNVRQEMVYLNAHQRPGDETDVATFAVYDYALLTHRQLIFRADEGEMPGFSVRAAGAVQLLDAPGGTGATAFPRCTKAPRVWWISVGADPAERQLVRCGYRFVAHPVANLSLWEMPLRVS